MSNDISRHLDKNNLHHAYLIEGAHMDVLPEVTLFIKALGIATSSNPDFTQIHIDNFKIDEALSLRSMADQRGYSSGKKIFIVSANNFSLDAQQTLLKMFEEPIEDTHFFLITPDANALLRTLVSRFYFIPSAESNITKDGEKFLLMTRNSRINFLKDFLKEEEEESVAVDSVRSKALRFLNGIEVSLHKKFEKDLTLTTTFEQIFKVRKFLRQPGSSTKSLMESVALVIPEMI